MHIVIVRFSSLGDIILSSSLPAAIKSRWSEKVKISFLTSKAFVPLVEGIKGVDQVIGFSRASGLKGLFELSKLFKTIDDDDKIDLIIDMHCTVRSLFLRLVNPTITRIYVDKRTIERSILTTFKLDFLSWQNQNKRDKHFGELLLKRNVLDFKELFDLDLNHTMNFVSEKGQGQLSTCFGADVDEIPTIMRENALEKFKYICLIPSASFPEKRWPVHKFKALIELLLNDSDFNEYKFVILAGPDDDFCREFDQFIGDQFVNLQGKTSLVESALILKNAKFCVGNDTGLPHISESVGRPACFILGPTGEEFGFYPHLKHSKIVRKILWCRPCTTNGKGNCIRSERFCLNLITENEVHENVRQMLSEVP